MGASRLHVSLIALVAGTYTVTVLPELTSLQGQVMALLGLLVAGHGLLLLTGIEEALMEYSAVPMLGYGSFLLFNAAWMSVAREGSGILSGADPGLVVLSVLLMGSGLIIIYESEIG